MPERSLKPRADRGPSGEDWLSSRRNALWPAWQCCLQLCCPIESQSASVPRPLFHGLCSTTWPEPLHGLTAFFFFLSRLLFPALHFWSQLVTVSFSACPAAHHPSRGTFHTATAGAFPRGGLYAWCRLVLGSAERRGGHVYLLLYFCSHLGQGSQVLTV